ncbi:MAG: hypothetical protein EPO60_00625, partial [Rugosibacter sp.]
MVVEAAEVRRHYLPASTGVGDHAGEAADFWWYEAKSDGAFWIPNNPVLQQHQLADPRDDAIRYMVRLSYPHLYNAKDSRFGIGANEYNIIAAFHDNASDAIKELVEMGTLKVVQLLAPDGDYFPDYYALLPENKRLRGPRGCVLVCDV